MIIAVFTIYTAVFTIYILCLLYLLFIQKYCRHMTRLTLSSILNMPETVIIGSFTPTHQTDLKGFA